MMNKIITTSLSLLLLVLTLSGCTLITQSDTNVSGSMITGVIIDKDNTDPTPEIEFTGNESTINLSTMMSGALTSQVTIITPVENSIIENPLVITGTAPGNWFFEGVAPVSIVNRNGLIIGEGYISAIEDWMTTGIVNFSGSIAYTWDPTTPYPHGRLILRRDNPSGMPENDAWIEMPILFE